MKKPDPQYVQEVWNILHTTYPNAHCELNYSNALELLIATMLSAQSTDVQINKVTEKLFKKYKTPQANFL